MYKKYTTMLFALVLSFVSTSSFACIHRFYSSDLLTLGGVKFDFEDSHKVCDIVSGYVIILHGHIWEFEPGRYITMSWATLEHEATDIESSLISQHTISEPFDGTKSEAKESLLKVIDANLQDWYSTGRLKRAIEQLDKKVLLITEKIRKNPE